MFNLEALLMILNERGEDMLFPDWRNGANRSGGAAASFTAKEDCFIIGIFNSLRINDFKLYDNTSENEFFSFYLKKDDIIRTSGSYNYSVFPLVKSGGG